MIMGGRDRSVVMWPVWVDAIQEWVRWMISAGKGQGTIELRHYQVARLAHHFVNCSPWLLRDVDLIGWLSGQAWSRETRRSYRSALRSFYGWAVIAGHVRSSPAATLPRIDRKRHLPRPTPAEIYAAALAGATDQARLCLLLQGYAGLRCAETAQLNRTDFTDVTIHVRGKGDRERYVPLHPLIRTEVNAEFARRDAGGHGSGFRYFRGMPDGWLFPGRYGGHITADGISHIAKRALGPNWSAHNNRHKFACDLYENGGDLGVIQELLGHESPETTKIYARVPDRLLAAAINAL